MWHETGVELNLSDEKASIDSCVGELNDIVSSAFQGKHTQNKQHATLIQTEEANKTDPPRLVLLATNKQLFTEKG